jgi:hypothetical protein
MLSRTISGSGAAVKIPEKIQSVGFIYGVRLSRAKMNATMNNFFFAKKVMALESLKYSIYLLIAIF